MLRARGPLALALASVLALVALSPVAAHAVENQSPAPGQAQVIDLPSEVRAQPRGVFLKGLTDDGHVAFEREQDPTGPDHGLSETVLAAPDGSTDVLDARVANVVGDRLVQPVETWADPVTVTSRLVDDTSWSTLTVPAGARFLDFTVDGVLVASGPDGSRELSVLPWDGTGAVPVVTLPAGSDAWTIADHVGSGSMTVVWTSSPSAAPNIRLLVDTARRQVWPVDASNPTCKPEVGGSWSINDGTLVWRGSDSSEQPVLCTAPLPAADANVVGPVTSRPWVSIASGLDYAAYRLTPVGDDVVVSSWSGWNPTWGTQELPILAVAPDGSTRKLARWGYGVVPAPSGRILAVTGTAPGQESVQSVAVSSGASRQVLAVAPVLAWYAGIAVDDDRVVYADDSADHGAVRQRVLDFAHGTAAASTLIDSDAPGQVTAGAGATAWAKWGAHGTYSEHLSPSGTLTQSTALQVWRTDERWVMHWNDDIEDTTTGAMRGRLSPSANLDLLDGVSYANGPSVTGGPAGSVIATDLATGQAAAIPISGCSHVYDVQAAGSWLLVTCLDTAGTAFVSMIVDRAGSTVPWDIGYGDTMYLGNGFVVAQAPDGSLSWTPLTGGKATWQPLGTAPADDKAVSVSRGDVPTAVWSSGRSAHAALIPVTTSPLPAHPTGVLPPTAPVPTLVATNHTILVSWPRPPDAEAVTGYTITYRTATGGGRTVSTEASGSATSKYLLGLTNGTPYDVQVWAWNLAGYTLSAIARATPILPPSIPTNLQLHTDPATDQATLTWDSSPEAGTEPVQRFSVWAGADLVASDLPPETRSVSFPLAQGWTGAIVLAADGELQRSTARLDILPPPPPPADITAPTAAIDVPAVVFGNSVSLSMTASDDRQLGAAPIDVRVRSAFGGLRLPNTWALPGEWEGRAPGRLDVTGLFPGQTSCFSVRAHDAAGNVSPWSSEHCFAVATDDRMMARSANSKKVSGAGYFRRTGTRLGYRSSWMQLIGLKANTGWLIASTCPTCGRVRVIVGTHSYGTVSLRSATVRNQVLLRLPFPTGVNVSGKLKLVPYDPRHRIVIDGVALLAH